MMTRMFTIEPLDQAGAVERAGQLAALLRDAVDSGASVGFLPPLDAAQARKYWEDVQAAMRAGTRLLLVAIEDGVVVGSVQLDLASMPNARHRAEMMKLFVDRRARKRGIARALIAAAENAARANGRTLLIADTRRGSAAE